MKSYLELSMIVLSIIMKRYSLFFILILTTACLKKTDRFDEKDYVRQIENWQKENLQYLKSSKNSPLNIAGLYWLEEGENTIGSSVQNDIVFPADAPQFIGIITLSDKKLFFDASEESKVLIDSVVIKNVELQTSKSGSPTLLKTGSFAWYILEYGDQYLIRLRNYNHPKISEFKGFEYFPIDPAWRLKAKFQPYDTVLTGKLMTANGLERQFQVLGTIHFKVKGQELKLRVSERGERFITIFTDKTNGFETYTGGRGLFIDKPDKNGFTVIDFNKTFNLNCAYTPFATCPLPSSENTLSVRIEAGEKIISK